MYKERTRGTGKGKRKNGSKKSENPCLERDPIFTLYKLITKRSWSLLFFFPFFLLSFFFFYLDPLTFAKYVPAYYSVKSDNPIRLTLFLVDLSFLNEWNLETRSVRLDFLSLSFFFIFVSRSISFSLWTNLNKIIRGEN